MAADLNKFNQWRRPKPDDWIIVRNWDRFQHYKNRNPPWIKNYRELLQDPDYLNLTPSERGLLHGIWLAYASADGLMQTRSLPHLVGMKVGSLQLFSLNHAGWIEFSASKPLAKCSLEVEKEIEKDLRRSVEKSKADRERELLVKAFEIADDWHGGGSDKLGDRLEELERELRARIPFQKRAQLFDHAFRHRRG